MNAYQYIYMFDIIDQMAVLVAKEVIGYISFAGEYGKKYILLGIITVHLIYFKFT